MMKNTAALTVIILCALLSAGCSTQSAESAQAANPAKTTGSYGNAQDIAFAGVLWQALTKRRLTGSEAVQTTPFSGLSPHGEVVQYLDTTLAAGGRPGAVIVLHNYSGSGTDSERDVRNVIASPGRFLQTIAVMYKRPGYDTANNNWFWVKYRPDGTPVTDEKEIALAGRIAKADSSDNCIGCHAVAPGGDGVFSTNRIK